MKASLILASASPQRSNLLRGLGIPFDVHPSSIDEAAHLEADPVARALILAELKATDVAIKNPGSWIIGCDTLVVAPDGTLLEKPADAEHARQMLELQSGKESTVHSGLALMTPAGDVHRDVSSSAVRFKTLSPAELDWWIQTGLWKDRSGSFQVDGPGQFLIEEIRGDWTGVVGLPVFLLGELLKKAGGLWLRS